MREKRKCRINFDDYKDTVAEAAGTIEAAYMIARIYEELPRYMPEKVPCVDNNISAEPKEGLTKMTKYYIDDVKFEDVVIELTDKMRESAGAGFQEHPELLPAFFLMRELRKRVTPYAVMRSDGVTITISAGWLVVSKNGNSFLQPPYEHTYEIAELK